MTLDKARRTVWSAGTSFKQRVACSEPAGRGNRGYSQTGHRQTQAAQKVELSYSLTPATTGQDTTVFGNSTNFHGGATSTERRGGVS